MRKTNPLRTVKAAVLIDIDKESAFDLMIDARRHPDFVYGYIRQDRGPEILSLNASFDWRINRYLSYEPDALSLH